MGAGVAKQCKAWRASSGRAGTTQFVFGTAVDQLSPGGSSGGFPWAHYTKEKDVSTPRRQIKKLVQAMSDLAGDTFGGVMFWDRGNDLTVGKKMPSAARPSALFNEAQAILHPATQ